MRQRLMRMVLAHLFAPLAAVVPLALFAIFQPLVLPSLNYTPTVWLIVAMSAIPIAYLSTLCIGPPTLYILERLGMASTANFALVGLAISLVPSAGIWLSGPTGDDRIYPFLFICCGVVVAATYGLIIERTLSSRSGHQSAA